MKKYSVLFLLILTLLIAACSAESAGTADAENDNKSTGDENLDIGVVLMSVSSEYWKMTMAGSQEAGEELGANVEVLGPTEETKFEEQVKIVEDQISKGVDALVIAASLPEAMQPALQNAQAAGIPVILIDANVESFEDKVTFIGTENFDAGKLAGEYAREEFNLQDGDKVAIIRGQLGAKVHDERANGFQNALSDLELDFNIQDAQSDRVKAVNLMENILTSTSDIKVVFATSDEMALGAYQGLDNSNKTDIPLIGFDGTPDGLKAVQDEIMQANIAQDPYQMGYTGVEAAISAIKGSDVEERIDSGATVITLENVDERIETVNGYLDK